MREWRAQDLRIGFTNGVFDLLHPGHIKVLAQARAACDRLVVGLNSDASVQRLKGKDRPIQGEHARAEVLAGARSGRSGGGVRAGHAARTDPAGAAEACWSRAATTGRDQVVGREMVEAQGGEVVLVDLVPGFSTTRIVEKSRARKPR